MDNPHLRIKANKAKIQYNCRHFLKIKSKEITQLFYAEIQSEYEPFQSCLQSIIARNDAHAKRGHPQGGGRGRAERGLLTN